MNDWINRLIFRVSGWEQSDLLAAKIPFVVRGLALALFFSAIFAYFYRRYFWDNKRARKLFFWSVGGLFVLILAKYAINFFAKGYVPDRLLFYALPSPRAQSILWFALPIIIFSAFLFFRKKIEALPRAKFLAAIYAFFCSFALAVAGIREGFASIADPFMRTSWEYSGNIPLVKSVKYFLENYNDLLPQLAAHSVTHPPGYSLVLYFFHKIFAVGFLGQAISLVLLSGLVIIPLYYLWVKIFTENRARKILQIFIFIPSVVMFTATSMDAFFMLAVWVVIALCFFGWSKSALLAGFGGLAAGVALFSNFLFLLLAPAFLLMILYIFKNAPRADWRKIFLRILASAGGFLLFFGGLYFWSGYSIAGNFFAAKAIGDEIMKEISVSAGYLTYILMNLVGFLFYLGLPMIYVFFSGGLETIKKSSWLFKVGLINLIFLLVIGVFQGEVERIWLFMVPFFAIGAVGAEGDEDRAPFSAILALLFFQIIIMQVLFYTYW